ncbi:hypothetical protein GRI34_02860 [Erythrobacter aquimaris]|uniref:Uncharacterized protein n=1 Tax=Qipengyuania aquimaris TaxID=255984 RepID=A0A6I4TJH4_9SPHN|nr:hypothetical protein [Qipengyuania aquimaris]MXO95360.1 hypothetical protein [Qipengyuania aquimaris]
MKRAMLITILAFGGLVFSDPAQGQAQIERCSEAANVKYVELYAAINTEAHKNAYYSVEAEKYEAKVREIVRFIFNKSTKDQGKLMAVPPAPPIMQLDPVSLGVAGQNECTNIKGGTFVGPWTGRAEYKRLVKKKEEWEELRKDRSAILDRFSRARANLKLIKDFLANF